jgi:hypothetical protein
LLGFSCFIGVIITCCQRQENESEFIVHEEGRRKRFWKYLEIGQEHG